MRILVEPPFGVGNADELQELDRARFRLRVVHPHMDRQRLGDLQPDREQRVERRHRLLEDHRDVAAADLAHLLVVEVEQVAAVEHDAALRDAAGEARQQPHHGERRNRLSRA